MRIFTLLNVATKVVRIVFDSELPPNLLYNILHSDEHIQTRKDIRKHLNKFQTETFTEGNFYYVTFQQEVN